MLRRWLAGEFFAEGCTMTFRSGIIHFEPNGISIYRRVGGVYRKQSSYEGLIMNGVKQLTLAGVLVLVSLQAGAQDAGLLATVKAGAIGHVAVDSPVSTGFYGLAGETAVFGAISSEFDASTALCAVSRFGDPQTLLGAVLSGDFLALALPADDLYVMACAYASGPEGDMTLFVLDASTSPLARQRPNFPEVELPDLSASFDRSPAIGVTAADVDQSGRDAAAVLPLEQINQLLALLQQILEEQFSRMR